MYHKRKGIALLKMKIYTSRYPRIHLDSQGRHSMCSMTATIRKCKPVNTLKMYYAEMRHHIY